MEIPILKMEDIARLAGVSKSAVSLTLSGKPGIGQDTRERILRIVQEYGYRFKRRSGKAGTTATSLTFMVLANSGIVSDLYYQQPFFRELIHHIEERCRAKGYSLMFSTIDYDRFEHDVSIFPNEKDSVGVILLGTNLTRTQIETIAIRFPQLVVLDTCYDTLPVSFVEINNVMGAYHAGRYLCEAGHRSIGYLASDVRIHNFEERKKGFLSALQECGIHQGVEIEFCASPTIINSQNGLKVQIEDYLREGHTLPSAIFCECDYLAISAMKTLAELGYHVPQDVSVVGFDNITESMVVSPELTTIHVEKERLAQFAVETLTNRLGQRLDSCIKIKIDTQLVKRSTCISFIETPSYL